MTTPWKVSFLDLSVHDDEERAELLAAVERVLRHGRIVLGPEHHQLETRLAQHHGRAYAVGCGSGSQALFLAFRAAGLGPGDEVIVPALSYIATANAVSLTGATPVFCDIGDDLNLDPKDLARCRTEKTKAVVPVHFTGKIADMAAINAFALEHDLRVIEDASQAFGAKRNGKPAGTFGHAACFSMNPMKVLAACGEAGFILCDEEVFKERLVTLRYNGTVNRETCVEPGPNGRLDTLQAAMLLVRLDRFHLLEQRRRAIAAYYHERLAPYVRVPREDPDCHDIYYTYTIQTDRRDALLAHLTEQGIECKIQHPILMPHQPYYAPLNSSVPHADQVIKKVLCIPANEKLTDAQIEVVADAIIAFFET
ncbi:DegT/DnrJ/EryC1/StrS family aminotransferase [Acanthopleuribacter pedis]|uniref:DegT/DnrJ/EryC1/StrS family aminotransferase n=1 Tax=Acanthopleuribacter pedis TaxID=442870 RepID=A0A8J7U1C0_9BACT|nr:DegT/DnrJ/EryC1/StrS family aminotransferase [Acanthopleuribacter pedis]MBO1318018.1 DegT/DnrJ/EryC1/StrS family aminotransferase [Acanthopleuribacter pedis]